MTPDHAVSLGVLFIAMAIFAWGLLFLFAFLVGSEFAKKYPNLGVLLAVLIVSAGDAAIYHHSIKFFPILAVNIQKETPNVR